MLILGRYAIKPLSLHSRMLEHPKEAELPVVDDDDDGAERPPMVRKPSVRFSAVEDPGGDDLLVVASRALVAGDAVTRDYGRAPSLGFIDGSDADPASESEVLRRLLQFGIYPQWSS